MKYFDDILKYKQITFHVFKNICKESYNGKLCKHFIDPFIDILMHYIQNSAGNLLYISLMHIVHFLNAYFI